MPSLKNYVNVYIDYSNFFIGNFFEINRRVLNKFSEYKINIKIFVRIFAPPYIKIYYKDMIIKLVLYLCKDNKIKQ